MPWVKIDDTFHDHPKVMQAGLPAIGLHVIALSHCARHLTDGHISPGFVQQKAGRNSRKLIASLVDAGLWEQNGDGWVIHDYLIYNPSREQVERDRSERSVSASHAANVRWGNATA